MTHRPTWPPLPAGTGITIVKLAPDGREITRYPGWLLDLASPGDWLAVRAEWTRGLVAMDGLRFVPGDELHEFFSLIESFNVFSVFAPDGTHRGWYANVTYPTSFSIDQDHLTITWHDLYLDLIALPGGATTVRDEDELAASGLATSDPELHASILTARDRLLALSAHRAFPFHEQNRDVSPTTHAP